MMLAKFWAIAAVTLATATATQAAPTIRATNDENVTYHIGLHAPNQRGLDERMATIAQHGGPWLSPEELKSYVSAKAEHVEQVKAYLVSQGVDPSAIKLNEWGDSIAVSSTVHQANTLWSTSLQKRSNNNNNNNNDGVELLADSLHIPSPLQSIISSIYPFTSSLTAGTRSRPSTQVLSSPISEVQAQRAADPNGCDPTLVTPECLRHFYGAGHWKPKPIDGQLDIITILLGGAGSDEADLHAYLHRYRPRIHNIDGYTLNPNVSTAGAEPPGSLGHGSEGFLDVELIGGVAAPLRMGQIKYGGPETLDMSKEFTLALRYVLDNYQGSNLPGVISVSYGTDELQVSHSEASTLCSIIQKLTAQGSTVVFASGDAGTDGSHGTQAGCKGQWTPPYPGGCPYVLSVGGLQDFSPPRAVDGSKAFFSGAGFSTIFDRPSWQNNAVQSYLSKLGSTGKGKYNAQGRAFPDISAAGLNIPVITVGHDIVLGGTSAAAPIAASIIALANNKRAHQGKQRLGFLHPRLYSQNQLTTDVTAGSTGARGCSEVLPATSGWDLATGLGYLNFEALVDLP